MSRTKIILNTATIIMSLAAIALSAHSCYQARLTEEYLRGFTQGYASGKAAYSWTNSGDILHDADWATAQ